MDHWSDETWRGRTGQPTLRAVSGHAVRVLPRPTDPSRELNRDLTRDLTDGLPDDLPRHPSLVPSMFDQTGFEAAGAESPGPGSPGVAEYADLAAIRVLVVGDDVLARRGVLAALDGEPGLVVVGEHRAGPAVAATLARCRPDVLLLHGLRAGDAAPVLAAVHDSVRRTGHVVRVLGTGVRDGEGLTGPAGGPDGATTVCGALPAWAAPEEVVAAVRIAAAGFVMTRADTNHPTAGRLVRTAESTGGRGEVLRDGLSERECDVLALVSRGMSNAEIAEELTVSEHTVKSHVQNLLGKLNLRNRIHAVIYAFSSGLVTPEHVTPR